MNKYLKLLGLDFFIMFVFLLMVFITSSHDFDIQRNDMAIIATFLVIGFMSILGIISDKNPYSINLMHWLFMFIFVFTAGLLQYLKNDFPWNFVLEDELILKANIVIILWCLIYYAVYNFKTFKERELFHREIAVNNKLFLFIFVAIVAIVFIKIVGFGNLFSREEFSTQLEDYSQITNLVLNTAVRAIPAVVLAYFIKERKLGISKNLFYIGMLFLINLLVNFPTGSARYWASSIYLGLFLLLKPDGDDKFAFCIIFICAFLVGFPVLNEFRNYTFEEVVSRGIRLEGMISFFLAGDFDAYSMICRSLDLVSQIGHSRGQQLLGAVFFFIPRSIWSSKPIGSGAAIAMNQKQYFTNISCPIIGEGVVNFGIIGVVLFAIAMAVIIKYLDTLYWDTKEKTSINALTLVYPFCLGFFFFIFRGDLMSSFAYLVGFCVSAFVLQFTLGVKKTRQDVKA